MKYYLDTEFNGFRGQLISLALVREDGASLYAVPKEPRRIKTGVNLWVLENVMPILDSVPDTVEIKRPRGQGELAWMIAAFLENDPQPTIVADWPDDIAYFCKAIMTGPGFMPMSIPGLKFEFVRVDAYPTKLEGAIQHNAWWDAMALKKLFEDAWT